MLVAVLAWAASARAQDRPATRPQELETRSETPARDDSDASDSWRFLSEDNLGGRGLLDMRDPFPLAQLHLQIPIDTLEVLEAGELQLTTRFRWANSFAKIGDAVLIDSETYEVQLGGWYAVHRSFYLGAELFVRARGGGVLDPIVSGFHDVFGVAPAHRGDQPYDIHEIVYDYAGTSTSLSSGVGFGDLTLKAHWNLWRGNAWLPAIAVEGLVALPSSTPGFGSDGVDLGASVSLAKTLLDIVHLHAVFGGTYATRPEVAELPFERIGYQGSIGIELEVLQRLSLVAQWTTYSPLLDTPVVYLDDLRNYLAFGLQWEVVPDLTIEFGVAENFAPYENSADIGFLFGLDWQL